MSQTHPNDAVSDLERDRLDHNPNADVIAGLREVADFLSQHPELPLASWANVSFSAGLSGVAPRALLGQVAEALEDRAEERVSYGDVLIEGRFTGNAMVSARAPVSQLADMPPVPEYEPIIRYEAVLPIDDSDFDE